MVSLTMVRTKTHCGAELILLWTVLTLFQYSVNLNVSAFLSHRHSKPFLPKYSTFRSPVFQSSRKGYLNGTESGRKDGMSPHLLVELNDGAFPSDTNRTSQQSLKCLVPFPTVDNFPLSMQATVDAQYKSVSIRTTVTNQETNNSFNTVDASSPSEKRLETFSRPTNSQIHSTIQSLLALTIPRNEPEGRTIIRTVQSSAESVSSHAQATLSSTSSLTDYAPFNKKILSRHYLLTNGHLSIRIADPKDDLQIAHLRMSAFTNLSPEDQATFCTRSSHVIRNRRSRGAICLVATNSSEDHIVGTLEGSTQEFTGTMLGKKRPNGSILYVTEVAVSPSFRRHGTGTMLMKGIERLARFKGIETIYLHVDVNNIACDMYRKVGFEVANKNDPIYKDFTTSLNLHDGATHGRTHHLLYKHLCLTPTWLTVPATKEKAVLGFEI